jgi:hypothetical protein
MTPTTPNKPIPEPNPDVVRPPVPPEAPAPDVDPGLPQPKPDVVLPPGPEVTTPPRPEEIPPNPGGGGRAMRPAISSNVSRRGGQKSVRDPRVFGAPNRARDKAARVARA